MPRPRWLNLAPDRRQAILDATLDEVAAEGFAQASINRILQAAGLSKSSFYYYFDDRADLLRTAVGRLAEGLGPELVAPIMAAPDAESFWNAVVERYARGFAWLDAHPRLRRVAARAVEHRGGPGELPAGLEAFPERVGGLLAHLATHGQEIGAVRTDLSPPLLQHLALAVMFAMDAWVIQDERLTPEGAAELVVNTLRRLLRVNSEPLR